MQSFEKSGIGKRNRLSVRNHSRRPHRLAMVCVIVSAVVCSWTGMAPAYPDRPIVPNRALPQPSPVAQAAPALSDAPLLPGVPGGLSVPLPPGERNAPEPKPSAPVPDGSGLAGGTGKYSGMVLVPAGTFDMGSPEEEGRIDERPQHKAFAREFYVGQHEVTAAQYCQFLNSVGEKAKDRTLRVNTDCPDCPVVKEGRLFKPKPGLADNPMVCVSWYGAADYAQWAGGRLPTAAEWEKAALSTTPFQPGDYLTVLPRKGAVPVTIASPGLLGVTGMAGNVWEWCSDWYDRDYYAKSPLNNPTGPALGTEKVIRGGSWASAESSKRIRNRHGASPRGYYRSVGFRIVKE